MTVDPNTQPQIGGDGAPAQGGNGAAGGLDPALVTPEHILQLRGENAARRNENKSLKDQVAALTAKLDGAMAPPAPKPDDRKPQSLDDVAAQLSETRALLTEAKQRTEALEKRDKEREAQAAKKLLRASLTRTLTEAKVLDIDAATLFLEARGARLTEDDRVVLDVTDEGGENQTVVLQGEALRKHKILTDHWFPPAGVGGSGSAAPRGAPASVDLERAKTDFKYYEEKEKQILEHQRAQQNR